MFEYKRNIRLNDCDPAGVIFFARVYDIAHEAFEEMLLKADNSIDNIINRSETIYPLISSSADYSGPIRLGDKINVKVKLKDLTENSISLSYLFEKENKIFTIVNTSQVSINKSTWKKSPIPIDFKNKLENLLS